MKRLNVTLRRGLLVVLIATACIAIMGIVIFSPFALNGIARFRSNWSQLSDIGQTYGAISALISSLALGGSSCLFCTKHETGALQGNNRSGPFNINL